MQASRSAARPSAIPPNPVVTCQHLPSAFLSCSFFFFFSSRRRHTRCLSDWSSDVCSSDLFAAIFESPDPASVQALLDSPWKGRDMPALSTRFYCLLISGAQGRATLRGVHSALLADVEANVREYFACIAPYSATPLPLYVLLRSLAVQRKPENLPPGLAGQVFLAILFGARYPRTLLSYAVQRCRAEQAVPRERAAVLNLFLYRNLKHKELNMGLNRESPEAGYRLGRLLAVLERMQTQANQGLNKTIVDRYYGAASTRPGTVFPSLIRLAPHHIAKLKNPDRKS